MNSYDAQSALPTKKHSKSNKEFSTAVDVVTLEMMLFLLQEEGVKCRSSIESLSPNDELREQLTKAIAIEALKSMSKNMLKDYGPEMRQLCGTLDLSDEQFYATYCSVAGNSLGYPDISMGRIVSLMTFTGLLASHLIKRGEDCKVERLLGWERMFIANKCQPCIEGLGGWVSHSLGTKPKLVLVGSPD